MPISLNLAKSILEAAVARPPISEQKYEFSFETNGTPRRQVALNCKSSKNAINLWIEPSIDPNKIDLSLSASSKYLSSSTPRAHLSAKRLTGPYKGQAGSAVWYVSLQSEADLRKLLAAYLNS